LAAKKKIREKRKTQREYAEKWERFYIIAVLLFIRGL
jgi:hypothetical protein